MKKIALYLIVLFTLSGCELSEADVFRGYPPTVEPNELVPNIQGVWKLSYGKRIEKSSVRQGNIYVRDSTIVEFKTGITYNIFKIKSELPIDNLTLNKTIWVFDSNYFYLNSLDRFDYILFNNNMIDITVPPTKRAYRIITFTVNKITIRTPEKYDNNNSDAKTESSYSMLEFTK